MLIDIIFKTALGYFIIVFVGKTYRNPHPVAREWFPLLASERGLKFLRVLATIWIFFAIVIIFSAFAPLIVPVRGRQTMITVVIVAMVGTWLVIRGQKE